MNVIEEASLWEEVWKPFFPLATNDFNAGIHRMPRPKALTHQYVEANPKAVSNLLVVDIDHSNASLRAVERKHGWMPNAVVENPDNGHAHAVWALKAPFARTEYAKRKPIALAAAVTEGLRRSVDGDKGYSGLITKNPHHKAWATEWFTGHLYELDELKEHLTTSGDLPPKSWDTTKRRKPVGLGRNCTIFETARHWAYREVRYHFGDSEGFYNAVLSHVVELNTSFSEPLAASETKAIAKSIHKWITTQSRLWKDGAIVYEANFTLIQSARGKKGGVKASREAKQRAGTMGSREAKQLAGQQGGVKASREAKQLAGQQGGVKASREAKQLAGKKAVKSRQANTLKLIGEFND